MPLLVAYCYPIITLRRGQEYGAIQLYFVLSLYPFAAGMKGFIRSEGLHRGGSALGEASSPHQGTATIVPGLISMPFESYGRDTGSKTKRRPDGEKSINL